MARKMQQNAAPPIDADFEDVSEPIVETGGKSLATRLTQTEIESQYDFAARRPRNEVKVRNAIVTLVHFDKDIAKTLFYSLPRGGKIVQGPNIRFAELVKQKWGNCHAESRLLEINETEMYVLAEGIFVDRETGSSERAIERRPIRDKYGKVYSKAAIDSTCAAACAIAKRNAIFASIPRPIWYSAYEDARRIAAGELKDLVQTRQDMIDAFSKLDIKPDMLLRQIGVSSEEEISLDHITTLRGMYSALKDNETTKDELFAQAIEARPEEKSDIQKKAQSLDDIKPKSAQKENKKDIDDKSQSQN